MNSANGSETVFTLSISSSRSLTREEMNDLDDADEEEETDDFQFGFHGVASSKPKKQVGKGGRDYCIQFSMLRASRMSFCRDRLNTKPELNNQLNVFLLLLDVHGDYYSNNYFLLCNITFPYRSLKSAFLISF